MISSPQKPGRSNHAEAVAPAEKIDPTQLTIDSRRTTYLIEYARALYGLRRSDEEVIALLVQARSGRGRMYPYGKSCLRCSLAHDARHSLVKLAASPTGWA